jgi:hypothetical protein
VIQYARGFVEGDISSEDIREMFGKKMVDEIMAKAYDRKFQAKSVVRLGKLYGAVGLFG